MMVVVVDDLDDDYDEVVVVVEDRGEKYPGVVRKVVGASTGSMVDSFSDEDLAVKRGVGHRGHS